MCLEFRGWVSGWCFRVSGACRVTYDRVHTRFHIVLKGFGSGTAVW